MRSHSLHARLVCIALLAATAVPLYAAPDDLPSPLVTATVRLHHVKASQVLTQLMTFDAQDTSQEAKHSLPSVPGVKSLSADDAAHRITVRGDKNGVARLRELVKLLDQPAPEVKLRASLTASPYVPGDDSLPRTTPLTSTEVKISNMETTQIPLSASSVAVQSLVRARVNGDRSVTLSYATDSRWRTPFPEGVVNTRQGLKSTRRLALGEVHRIALTASDAASDETGTRRQFYLELTPVSVKVP